MATQLSCSQIKPAAQNPDLWECPVRASSQSRAEANLQWLAIFKRRALSPWGCWVARLSEEALRVQLRMASNTLTGPRTARLSPSCEGSAVRAGWNIRWERCFMKRRAG